MSKPTVGSIQRTARITSLILCVVPFLVFLGFTIYELIAKYFSHHGLTWLDIVVAFGITLRAGLFVGSPLLIAILVAERKPLVGAIIMLILAIPFILMPIISLPTADNWTAAIGLIYIVPALLYLVSWRRGRL